MSIPSLRTSLLAATAAGTLLGAVPAAACGPDFPPELLEDRAQSLAFLPDGVFAREVAQLVPKPAEAFRVVEGEEPAGARSGGGARERALYREGARAFRAMRFSQAREKFAAVMRLPAAERHHFSTFAAFMLGRLGPESRRWFGEVRKLAAGGFEDPLGLAAASFGEEARRLLEPELFAGVGEPPAPPPDEGADVTAIRLYATQAALGSGSGVVSLLFLSRALVADDQRLEQALRHPLGQRLLVAYAWTRGDDHVKWAGDRPRRPVARLIQRLAALPRLTGADRLAAAAWRAGQFDLAERFAGAEESGLSLWVRAKLALRRGDRPGADRLLAEAATRFPETERWSGEEWRFSLYPRRRIAGERAVLALAREDFRAAMEEAMAAGSWRDAAYIAERVLTTRELQEFVDRRAAVAGPAAPAATASLEADEGWGPQDQEVALRGLLARRLLREGRQPEALRYFSDPAHAAVARQYVDLLERSRQGGSIDRAEALWKAACIARQSGMEILGSELAPDWGWVEGELDLSADWERNAGGAPAASAAGTAGETSLVTRVERRRAAAHGPSPDRRFHYRSTAADLAEQAASLVPRRSQAYAALLCQAARFVKRVDADRFRRIWRTYVKRGARVDFAATFGETCPDPDLDQARHPPPARGGLHLPRRRTLALAGTGVALLLALAAVLIQQYRSARSAS